MSHKTTLSADGSTGYVTCKGSVYQITAAGTWGSGTITPQITNAAGTAVALGTATLTANGTISVEVSRGDQLRATLSGSTEPSLVVHIKKVA